METEVREVGLGFMRLAFAMAADAAVVRSKLMMMKAGELRARAAPIAQQIQQQEDVKGNSLPNFTPPLWRGLMGECDDGFSPTMKTCFGSLPTPGAAPG